MIWLRIKRLWWNTLIDLVPCWIVSHPDTSWRHRLTLWVYVKSQETDYEIYEYNLPLRVTPEPGTEDGPF